MTPPGFPTVGTRDDLPQIADDGDFMWVEDECRLWMFAASTGMWLHLAAPPPPPPPAVSMIHDPRKTP
jgi:hypothetical protein